MRWATQCAVEDFPEAAGPSIAMTTCERCSVREGMDRQVGLRHARSARGEAPEIVPEPGIRHGDAFPVVDLDHIPWNGTEDSEGHRESVVAMSHHAATQRV